MYKDTYKVSDVPTTAFEFTKYENFTKFSEKNPELIKSLKENNALVINGEGTIHDSRPAPLALLYTAYVAKKIMNKHVRIINHSAYPSDDQSYGNKQENEKIYKLVYDVIDVAVIREPESVKAMKAIKVKNIIEGFDSMPIYYRGQISPSWHQRT